MTDVIETWNRELGGADAGAVLAWAARAFGDRVAFASSMGAEDQVITDLIVRGGWDIPVFTLDTGRLHPETIDLVRVTEAHYGIRIRIFAPDAAEVEAMVKAHGPDMHRESVELRRRCCEVRKLRPLRRALAGRAAWICGLRREQAVTRRGVERVEADAATGLVKINPLADWATEAVWRHLRGNRVPVNPLHDRGYPSIGCACCTRAVAPGEDLRAGRWWWESPDHRECGLHPHGTRPGLPGAPLS